MIGRARRVIVVADGPEVGKLALARIRPIEAVDELSPMPAPTKPSSARLEAAGVTVAWA